MSKTRHDDTSTRQAELAVKDEPDKTAITTTKSNTPTINERNVKRGQQKQRQGRHGARNQHRHKLFVRWLLATFPDAIQHARSDEEDNNENGGDDEMHVLDVAGGKGELSARLTLCHCTRVVMIDPRRADVADCFRRVVFRSLPKKWQERITRLDEEEDGRLRKIVERRFRQMVVHFPSDGTVDGVCGGEQIGPSLVHDSVVETEEESLRILEASGSVNDDIVEAVKRATLMIGMHADGATEAIVDLALRYRKPFVVVPCCVFPNFFRHRLVPQLVEGTEEGGDRADVDDERNETNVRMVPVRTHEQFCRYLALKDSHLVVETLPFEGRNVAIWWDGKKRDGDHEEENGT